MLTDEIDSSKIKKKISVLAEESLEFLRYS